jgi:hypothetical protein
MVSVAEVVEMALRGLDRSDAVYLMREVDIFTLAQAAEAITRKFFGNVVTFVNNVVVNFLPAHRRLRPHRPVSSSHSSMASANSAKRAKPFRCFS